VREAGAGKGRLMPMRNERFWPRVLFACFLVSAMVAPTLARADITDAPCYGTLEYQMRCDDDSGCEETVTIPTCIPGNVGPVCQHGSGLCCSTEYTTSSADGSVGRETPSVLRTAMCCLVAHRASKYEEVEATHPLRICHGV
jgi:hypothetical protein